MTKQVDSYRFISRTTRRVMQAWIARETPRPIPWVPLTKPLSECTVALISTAGISMNEDPPFDQEGERQNQWWGDPSSIFPLPGRNRQKLSTSIPQSRPLLPKQS